MNELRELYQEVILDHGRNPRNFRRIEDADGEAKGDNPLCGDRVHVYRQAGRGGRASATWPSRAAAAQSRPRPPR